MSRIMCILFYFECKREWRERKREDEWRRGEGEKGLRGECKINEWGERKEEKREGCVREGGII